MNSVLVILLTLLAAPVQAEVFKCLQASGKTLYQPAPCRSDEQQETVDIEPQSPEQAAEAEARLKAWNEDFAKREAARIKAEQEHQAELDRKASIKALQESAKYQKQQAYEAKRQADALERQNQQDSSDYYLLYPYYPPFAHQPHHNKDKPNANTGKTNRNRLKQHNEDKHERSKIIFKWQ